MCFALKMVSSKAYSGQFRLITLNFLQFSVSRAGMYITDNPIANHTYKPIPKNVFIIESFMGPYSIIGKAEEERGNALSSDTLNGLFQMPFHAQ